MASGVSSSMVFFSWLPSTCGPGRARYQKPYSIRESGPSRCGREMSCMSDAGSLLQPTKEVKAALALLLLRPQRRRHREVTNQHGKYLYFQRIAVLLRWFYWSSEQLLQAQRPPIIVSLW